MLRAAEMTVSELNLAVDEAIRRDPRLQDVTVRGEVSGFKHHLASGHWYFAMKDAEAAVNCVMFRQNNLRSLLKPKDGDSVVVTGYVKVYARSGACQLYVTGMRSAGTGDLHQRFEELVGRHEGIESMKRNRILYTRVVCIECDDVGYAHGSQLLKRKRAVQGFTHGTFMLSSFIKERHDYGDAFCLAVCGRDDPFQILIVVIGRHMVLMTAYGIGKTVICNINEYEEIASANGFVDLSFTFSCTETGTAAVQKIAVFTIAVQRHADVVRAHGRIMTKINEISIYCFTKIPAAFQHSELQGTNRHRVFKGIICHECSFII